MGNDFVKDYFNRVKDNLESVNRQDTFFDSFANSINNGDNILFQKHMMETRIFDSTWVDYIEDKLQYLDNIMRNPKSFIKDVEDIVPVERAKATTPQAIRYLASHSHHIKEVTRKGEVIPKKILSSYKDEELGIYENRFIKTLTDKLIIFVEKRYNTIKELIGTDYINKFHSQSNFHFEDLSIEYEMNLNILKKINNNEAEQKNFELLARIEKLRGLLMSFINSELMITLKSIKHIVPPVQRTNIIMKDRNYRKCYEMWLFLDSYGKLDYTIDTSMSNNTFNDDYLESLQYLALLSFSTVVGNDDSNIGEFAKVKSVNRRKKKPKILNSYDPDKQERKTNLEMESHIINEYYYQQARKLYSSRIHEQVGDGQPFHSALHEIYQSAFKITETIFSDLMEIPEEVKNDPVALLRYRIRNQKALDRIYQYKTRDLKKMEKAKLRNDRIIEREKAKIEGKAIPLTAKQLLAKKEREKVQLLRQQEREKAKLLRQQAKERERLIKQKEIAKARIANLKAKELEKARIAKEKAKEKERLAKLKAREREKARLAREKAKEREKARLAKEKEKAKARYTKSKVIRKPKINNESIDTINSIELEAPEVKVLESSETEISKVSIESDKQ